MDTSTGGQGTFETGVLWTFPLGLDMGLGGDIEALSYNGKLIPLPPATASRDSPGQAVTTA